MVRIVVRRTMGENRRRPAHLISLVIFLELCSLSIVQLPADAQTVFYESIQELVWSSHHSEPAEASAVSGNCTLVVGESLKCRLNLTGAATRAFPVA